MWKNIALSLVFSVFLAACSDDPVSIVKKGTLALDNTVTVGNSFDQYKYFSKKKWTTFEDAQKRVIVEFEGEFAASKMDKSNIPDEAAQFIAENYDKILDKRTLVLQFAVLVDKKNFEIYAGNVLRGGISEKVDTDLIKNIYRNEEIIRFRKDDDKYINEAVDKYMKPIREAKRAEVRKKDFDKRKGKYLNTWGALMFEQQHSQLSNNKSLGRVKYGDSSYVVIKVNELTVEYMLCDLILAVPSAVGKEDVEQTFENIKFINIKNNVDISNTDVFAEYECSPIGLNAGNNAFLNNNSTGTSVIVGDNRVKFKTNSYFGVVDVELRRLRKGMEAKDLHMKSKRVVVLGQLQPPEGDIGRVSNSEITLQFSIADELIGKRIMNTCNMSSICSVVGDVDEQNNIVSIYRLDKI